MNITKSDKKISTRDRNGNPCIVDLYTCDSVFELTGGTEVNIELLEVKKVEQQTIVSETSAIMESAEIELQEIIDTANDNITELNTMIAQID